VDAEGPIGSKQPSGPKVAAFGSEAEPSTRPTTPVRGLSTVRVCPRGLPTIQVAARSVATEACKQKVIGSIPRQRQPNRTKNVTPSVRPLDSCPTTPPEGPVDRERLAVSTVERAESPQRATRIASLASPSRSLLHTNRYGMFRGYSFCFSP
jgi:hypothetical protein